MDLPFSLSLPETEVASPPLHLYYIILLQTTYIERFCSSLRSNKSWQALQDLHLGNTKERMELVEVTEIHCYMMVIMIINLG